MLNDKKMKIGSTQIILALIMGVIVITGLIYFWNRNNIASYNVSNAPIAVTPVITAVRINWQAYHDTKLNFSIRYSSNYTISETTSRIKRNKPVLEMDFIPVDKSNENTDTIFLTVYARNNASTIEDWLKTYTTSSSANSPTVEGKNYLLYNVINIQTSSSSGKTFTIFERNSPNFVPSLIYGAVFSPKYIYLLSHSKDQVDDIYQKMLASLTF